MGHSLMVAAALLSLGAWLGLAFLRGGFWRAVVDGHLGAPQTPLPAIRVEAVIPARNEAAVIERSLRSIVEQRFSGTLHVTLVDDHSDDDTAGAARGALASAAHARPATIVTARSLEAGWTGKLNALQSGIEAVLASRSAPDYWLFTDADIEHESDNLAALVAVAKRERLDLASLMVHLHCTSFWDRLLVPAFVFFFQKLYPFAWSNDPRRTTAAAAGGCMLLAHSALERIGGLTAIADRLIDDCALAGAVKKSGGRIRLGLTNRARSIRPYAALGEVWSMVKRSAFTQLNHSYALLTLTVVGMALLYLAPPALTVYGLLANDPLVEILASFTWLLAAVLYLPTLRAYGQPAPAAFALPIAAALYTAMTLDSALAHARQRGGVWKGRTNTAEGALERG
jgi:hopene-associated glycosyltransferase HpnB